MSGAESRHVLICGHRAFAARGLRDLLEMQGHRVTEFSRGPREGTSAAFTGPVTELHCNPYLAASYDVVVNFIVLRDESVQRNLDFCESLWRMCRDRKVRHLIQISSLSVYPDSVRVMTEHSATKIDLRHCGTYAASKVAAERCLRERSGPDLKLSLVRPAWIVGDGMFDPVGSTAERLASGKLLVLGKACRQRPVIGRSVLHRALARLVISPPREDCEVLLLVDRDSPTYLEFLQACCDFWGRGTQVVAYAPPIWMALLLLREFRRGRALSIRGTMARALSTLRQRLTQQQYDPSWTEARLGMSLATRWREELVPKAVS